MTIRAPSSLLLAFLATLPSPGWTADTTSTRIGTTQPVATTANATAPASARQDAADLEQARLWGLTIEDIRRARTLMQPGSARATFSAPHLSPVEALGIHARNDTERRKYAELFARALHEDTERVVAWIATYSAAYARLYPNEPAIDFHGRNLPRSVIAP